MGKSFINEETQFKTSMQIYVDTIRYGKRTFTKDRAEKYLMQLAEQLDELKKLEKDTHTDAGKEKLCRAVWRLW